MLFLEDYYGISNFLVFITGLVLALRTIPVIVDVAKLKQLMDEPNDRSSHENKVPTLGGVAIFIAVTLSIILFDFNYQQNHVHLFLGSLIILFFTGLKDDILIISPYKKLIAQILAVLLITVGADIRIGNLFGLFGIFELNYFFSLFLTTFVFIVILNAFNLMDGIDGLAGGMGIMVSLVASTWFYMTGHHGMVVIALAMAGALTGFLYFNFSVTKKVFMGDTGSMLVGFTLAFFVVHFLHYNEPQTTGQALFTNAPAIAIGVLIIPLFDTLRVFIIRLRTGKSPFKADNNHLHHLLLQKNLNHGQASFILVFSNLFFIVFMSYFFYDASTNASFMGLFLFFIAYMYLTQKLATLETPAVVYEISNKKSA